MPMNDVINAYRSSRASSAEYSDAHELVTMLYDGALERLSRAIGHIERDEIASKGECLGRVAGIIGYLRDSLDPEAGDGTVSENLDALYEYMLQRVIEANLRNDAALLAEVRDLVAELRAGWVGIPPEQRNSRNIRAATAVRS